MILRSLLVAVPFALVGVGSALACDGKAEVAAAFAKQQKEKAWRSVVETENNAGKQEQTTEFIPPDRMYRKLLVVGQEPAIETISIAQWAWSNQGGGWGELQPPMAKMLQEQVKEITTTPPKVGLDFACLGKAALDGKDYVAYRTAPDKAPDGMELVRTIYVDEATGLPAFNTIGDAKPGVVPLVKEAYTYPTDIVIEKP